VLGENPLLGSFEGILIKEVDLPPQSVTVAWAEYHWDGVDPPPQVWVDEKREAFRNERYAQWSAWVTAVPEWVTTPDYTSGS
jgi:hypothetical protein